MNPEQENGEMNESNRNDQIQSLHPVPDTGPLEITTEINGMAIRVTAQVDSKYSRNNGNKCEDAIAVALKGHMIGFCLADGVSQGTSNEATKRFAEEIAKTVARTIVEETQTLPSIDDFQEIIKKSLQQIIIKEKSNNKPNQAKLAASVMIALLDIHRKIAYVLHLGDGFCGEVDEEGRIHAFFGRKKLLPRTETLDEWEARGDTMDEIMEKLALPHRKKGLTSFVSAGERNKNRWENEDLGNAVAVIPFHKGTSLIFGSDGILEEAIELLSYSKDLAEYKADIPYEIYEATGPKRRRRDDTCMAAVYLGQ